MCLHFTRTLNRKGMEKRKVTVELTVYTERMTDREIEQDIDRLVLPLRHLEYGHTSIEEVKVKEVK